MIDMVQSIFSMHKPPQHEVEAFIASEAKKPFPYSEVGASHHRHAALNEPDLATRYRVLHHRFRLGSGQHTYQRARAAVDRWQMFHLDWVQLCWPNAPVAVGSTVAILSKVMGIWAINGCRIIYVIDDQAPVERYGFGYGTTPGHAMVGEERLCVEWHHQDDSVWYDIYSFSKKSHLLAKLGSFHLHGLQMRFANESHHAMMRAVRG